VNLCLAPLLPQLAKECGQQRTRLGFTNPGNHRKRMVEPLCRKNIELRTAGTGFGILTAIDEA
jgi:hypothetical protein